MIYIANYGTAISTAALNALNSFVALGTTPAGFHLAKDASGNFVATADSGGAAVITTQDEGVTLSTSVTTLNFVGAGVTASGAGATTTVTIPGGASLTVGTTAIASGSTGRVLYDNGGVLGEYTISGTGSVAMTTSPTFVTPTLGAATATTYNGMTVTTSTGTFTLTNAKVFSVTNTLTLSGTDGSTLNIGAGGTLGSAAFTSSSAYEVPLTFSTGLTRTTNTITVNTSQNITTLSNLTSNGLVTTSGGTGALSITVPGTGVLAALAIAVGSAGAFVTFNGAGGTPSSITLTNGTGLPVSGITSSTSTALGVGSLELGNASDTTLSRQAAGVLAVEGETINGYTTTATAAGTTTLTVSATKLNFFTGSSTQTVKLPTTSVILGQQYVITNQSTGLVTVQSSGANTIATLGLNQTATFTAMVATPTSAANWSYEKTNLSNNMSLKRTLVITQSATPAINTDNGDVMQITGLAQAITGFTMTGTPGDGDSFILEITDNGTGRALTFGSAFESSTVNLPSTTVANTKLTIGFIRNATTSKWRCVAVA